MSRDEAVYIIEKIKEIGLELQEIFEKCEEIENKKITKTNIDN